jgi:thioredoxin reductase (NADPH)
VIIEALDTGGQRNLTADGVFIFIGYEPTSGLVPAEIEKSAEGFVVTDEKGATNVPGIFVAGDLRRKYANQIVIAAADGAVAGLAASRYVESRRCAGHEACAR